MSEDTVSSQIPLDGPAAHVNAENAADERISIEDFAKVQLRAGPSSGIWEETVSSDIFIPLSVSIFKFIP